MGKQCACESLNEEFNQSFGPSAAADLKLWQAYERRKQHIRRTSKSPEEYQTRIGALADELGL